MHKLLTELKQNLLRMWLPVLLGVAVSLFAFYVVRDLEQQQIERELKIATVDRLTAVQRALDTQFQLMRSVASYTRSPVNLDLENFRHFVDDLTRSNSALQGISWVPSVTLEQRQAFENMAQQQGLTNYHITERDADGSLVSADARAIYMPVLYIEPKLYNEPAVGFDLLSEPHRRKTLEAARDSGNIATTVPLELVQGGGKRSGFLLALPVYQQNMPLASVDARRDALQGFVTGVFWVEELVEAGLANLQPGGIDLYFYDTSDESDGSPLYVHSSRIRQNGQNPALSGSFLSHSGQLDVGGHQWKVVGVPAPGFLVARKGPLPWVLLVTGLLATAVFLGSQWLIARRNRELVDINAEIKGSEARIRRVVESMPAVLLALDDQQKVIAWNAEGEQVTGFDAATVIGQPATFLVAADGSGVNLEPEAEDFRDVESTLLSKDGTVREIAWTRVSESIPIPGWASWLIGIDVTGRNRIARENKEILEQSLQGQKLESLGLLAGGIAHDFNNLLTAILGNASLAQEIISPSSPARNSLDGVVQAAERASLLTQQLLAYTGKGTFQTQPIDLSEHVREIVNLLQAAISSKISLRFELGENLPAVNADPSQMQQLVMNLVINAAEAAGDEFGTVHVRTGTQLIDEHYLKSLPGAYSEIEPGLYLYLEIQDDGLGMDPETQARIFDPFFSTKFSGRGLGLAAAMGIVRSHGGSMKVYSTPGQGSVFKVFLPASTEVATTLTTPLELKLPEDSGLILVVDDEPMICQLAERALTPLGYTVITAADGVEAIEIIRERGSELDCVLLDMTMPRLDGEQTFKILHELQPNLPTILSSGYNEIAATKQFVGRGIAGFLQKPYTALNLGAKIQEVLKVQRTRT